MPTIDKQSCDFTLSSCVLKIWKSKTESSGRHRHKYEWTPLNGQGRLKVLGRLNWSDVDELVEGEAGDGVKKLWEVHDDYT